MRRYSKKRTTAKERELTERVRELEEKFAASVPRAELEAVKSNLQLEISGLKMRLSVAEEQASQAKLPRLAAEGRLDDDGVEEKEAEGSTAKMSPMGSSAGDSEESEGGMS